MIKRICKTKESRRLGENLYDINSDFIKKKKRKRDIFSGYFMCVFLLIREIGKFWLEEY